MSTLEKLTEAIGQLDIAISLDDGTEESARQINRMASEALYRSRVLCLDRLQERMEKE